MSPTATSDVTDQQFPAAAIIRFGQLVRNLASVLGNHDCDDGGLKRAEHTLRHAVQCLQSEMPDGLAPEFDALFAIHAEAAMSPDELHVLAERACLAGSVACSQPTTTLAPTPSPTFPARLLKPTTPELASTSRRQPYPTTTSESGLQAALFAFAASSVRGGFSSVERVE